MAEMWIKDLEKLIFNGNPDYTVSSKLIHEHIPNALFRFGYFDENDYWKSDVRLQKIHVSCPYFFNDPFDCELSLNKSIQTNWMVKNRVIQLLEKRFHIKDYDKNRIKYSDDLVSDIIIVLSHHGARFDENKYDSDVRSILENTDDLFRKVLGVICFSENLFSNLMWSHYAKYHSGYCIQYDFSGNNFVSNTLFPVIYSKERINVSEKLKAGENQFIITASICKSEEWKYEREWRYLDTNPMRLKSEVKLNEIPFYIDASEFTRAIYLGAKISQEHEKELIEFGNDKNLPVYKMKLSNLKYELLPQRVN